MTPRTDADLAVFSNRLLHDVQVFFHVARLLVRARVGFARPLGWEVEMAAIESFALHTRGLADFFFTFKRSSHDHDAFAFHFFDSPAAWELLAAEKQGPWLRRIRFRPRKGVDGNQPVDRFGQEIAHLTYHAPPVSDYARGWPVMQVASEMGSVLRAFVDNVPPAKIAADFKAKAMREIPVVARLDHERFAMGVWTRPMATRPLS